MNRVQFFEHFHTKLTAEELLYVQTAYFIAKDAHRTQSRRLTGERFFEHLRRVALLSDKYGYSDANIIVLDLLHDVGEDTNVPPRVLVNLFGAQMYKWISDVSKEHAAFNPITGEVIGRCRIPDDEFYARLAEADLEPRITKSCDRLDNVADLHLWEKPRQNKYIIETNDRLMPMIRKPDLRIAAAIEEKLKFAETV